MDMLDSATGIFRRSTYRDADNYIADIKLRTALFADLLFTLYDKLGTRYGRGSTDDGPMETHESMVAEMEKALENADWKCITGDGSVGNEITAPGKRKARIDFQQSMKRRQRGHTWVSISEDGDKGMAL